MTYATVDYMVKSNAFFEGAKRCDPVFCGTEIIVSVQDVVGTTM